MVATSGAGWVLAPCLKRLIDETDRLFPKRDTSSDGSIGDQAHAARDSDHNPDDGYVHAVDVTDDDLHGCNVGLLAAHLVATKDRRVKYLIHKGTIWKSYASNGLAAWTPQVYTGTNAHLHHLHVSILDGQENASGTWWPQSQPKPAPPIALSQEEDVLFYDDPSTTHPGTYMLAGGKVAQLLNTTDVTELKKAAKDPNYTAKLSKAGADQLRKVFING